VSLHDHLLRFHLAHRSTAEHEAMEEARLYRNLLHLLPYCVPRTVVPARAGSAVVYFSSRNGRPGTHHGWA